MYNFQLNVCFVPKADVVDGLINSSKILYIAGMVKSKINAEIECLRAVAILLVVSMHLSALLHWGPPDPPYFGMPEGLFRAIKAFPGWAGVDLFFCISGYVISLSFVELLEQKKAEGKQWVAAKAFWVRRFFRIIPSAWLWILVPIVCSVYFNESGEFLTLGDNLRSAISVFFYVANFAMLYGWLPNGIYWSLATEEQFYFLFPIFLILFAAPSRFKIFLALIAIQLIPDRSEFHYFFWVFRLDALMWGCLIYQFSKTKSYRQLESILFKRPWIVIVGSFVLIAMLGLTISLIKIKMVSLVAVWSAILVLLASYQRGYVLGFPPPIKSIFLWIGSRSYGLYLIHIPTYHMAYELWFRIAGPDFDVTYTTPLLLTAIPLLCVLTEINYRWIEVPLRRKGAAIANRMTADS
jgi:peptidoglycan/LPS O-acetylase OafA/YrhL